VNSSFCLTIENAVSEVLVVHAWKRLFCASSALIINRRWLFGHDRPPASAGSQAVHFERHSFESFFNPRDS
jgi:hypothetical protein